MARRYTGWTDTKANADLDALKASAAPAAQGFFAAQRAAGMHWVADPSYGTLALAAAGAGVTGVVVISDATPVAATTTVTARLVFVAGGKIVPASGVTVTLLGEITAERHHIFDADGVATGTIALGAATPTVYPEWWGAVGEGTTDDITPLQRGFDCVMAANDNGAVLRYELSRRYRITNSLRGFRYAGGAFQYVQYELAFTTRSYIEGKGGELLPDFVDRPALIVQAARTVVIENPTIRGAIASVAPTYANLLADDGGAGGTPWYNPGNLARDTQYSPQCGIAIDPFYSALPADGGIPGHAAYYTHNRASSIVKIRAPKITKCIVGIALSLSNGTQLGDSITITEPNFEYCKVPVAVGQSQNRGITIERPHILYCRTAFDTITYGTGNGPFPNIEGGVIAGGCRYLMNGSSAWGSGRIRNLYAESVQSLGAWGWSSGGFELTFDTCHIVFANNAVAAGGPGYEPDYHLHAAGPVMFRGGYLGHYRNEYRRLSVYNGTMVQFDGTVVDGEPQFSSPRLVRWASKCPLRYSGLGGSYGVSDKFHDQLTVIGSASYAAKLAPYGEVMDGAGNNFYRYRWRGVHSTVSLGTVALTVASDGTGTFTDATIAVKLQVGDWITTSTIWNGDKPTPTLPSVSYAGLLIGKVTAVNTGTGAVTLGNLPHSIASGNWAIQLDRYPLFRQRTVGTSTAGSKSVTGVSPASAWAAGNRIESPNFPAGTYVVSVGAGTLELSQNATASGLTEFYDGRLYLEAATQNGAPTSGSWFKGDFVAFGGGTTKDANNMVLRGWYCTVSGSPGTWEPQYVSTVSPAT